MSPKAGAAAVTQVVPSRIAMAIPTMVFPPLVMHRLEKTAAFVKNPWLKAPVTVLITGICLALGTPLGCAVFPQRATIRLESLEPDLQEKCRANFPGQQQFYYNKGL